MKTWQDFSFLGDYVPLSADARLALFSRYGLTRQTGLPTRETPLGDLNRQQFIPATAGQNLTTTITRYMVGIFIQSNDTFKPAVSCSIPLTWPANLKVTLRSFSAWSQDGFLAMGFMGPGNFIGSSFQLQFAIYRLDDFTLISENASTAAIKPGAPYLKWNAGNDATGGISGRILTVTETNSTIRGSLHSLLPFETVMTASQLLAGKTIMFTNNTPTALPTVQTLVVIAEWLEELPNV